MLHVLLTFTLPALVWAYRLFSVRRFGKEIRIELMAVCAYRVTNVIHYSFHLPQPPEKNLKLYYNTIGGWGCF